MNALPPEHGRELARAVRLLEEKGLAIRVANLAAKPLDGALTLVPGVSGALHGALRRAIMRCLTIAIESQEGEAFAPDGVVSRTLAGLVGGIGGLFGAMALPFEMPLTMTVMLRAIADIARHNGEDLRELEPRLACLEVFALGERGKDAGGVVGYYAARVAMSKLTRDVITTVVERRAADLAAPVMERLAGELVSRLGLALSERAAASAVPILGAFGGAALNILFTDYFTDVAEGHFTVRRLERLHGAETIQRLYRTEMEALSH